MRLRAALSAQAVGCRLALRLRARRALVVTTMVVSSAAPETVAAMGSP